MEITNHEFLNRAECSSLMMSLLNGFLGAAQPLYNAHIQTTLNFRSANLRQSKYPPLIQGMWLQVFLQKYDLETPLLISIIEDVAMKNGGSPELHIVHIIFMTFQRIHLIVGSPSDIIIPFACVPYLPNTRSNLMVTGNTSQPKDFRMSLIFKFS